MAWLREKVRTWLGVQDTPPVDPVAVDPWDDASYKAQDAGDILVACEKRLANDATLLAMCNEFLGESEEPQAVTVQSYSDLSNLFSPLWSCFSSPPKYDASPAFKAVREERNRIRVRIAEANLAKANAALPKKRKG